MLGFGDLGGAWASEFSDRGAVQGLRKHLSKFLLQLTVKIYTYAKFISVYGRV